MVYDLEIKNCSSAHLGENIKSRYGIKRLDVVLFIISGIVSLHHLIVVIIQCLKSLTCFSYFRCGIYVIQGVCCCRVHFSRVHSFRQTYRQRISACLNSKTRIKKKKEKC